jgi:hypothetical protein
MTPHKHAELIKAWADGSPIQYRAVPNHGDWKDAPEHLIWDWSAEYRIKPKEEYVKYRDAFPKDYDLPTYFTSKHAVSMTLRDYFAAKAMQGMMVDTEIPNCTHIAKESYRMADAMLKAREA